MKVTVTKEFYGRPDSEPLPRVIAEGEEITGDLAAYAVGAGFAEAAGDAPKEERKPARKRRGKGGA